MAEQKWQHNSDHKPELVKDQKLNCDEEPEIETEPGSITSICYELLERIFDFLDFKNLLNVAHTCKRLQIAAAAKFNDQYGNKRIRLYQELKRSDGGWYCEDDNEIYMFGTKFCLSFLRCFGSNVSDLGVNYSGMHERDCSHLDQYINQYCAHTLNSISICFFEYSTKKLFETPFKNVEKVRIEDSKLGKELPNFVKWFPNLRHLHLRGCSMDNNFCSETFPHLEYLSIPIAEKGFLERGLESFLHANRQLQRLSLSFDCYYQLKISKLLNMISGHTLISKLKIITNRNLNVSASEFLQLASKHPAMVELNLRNCLLRADDAIALIGQLPFLKSFKFRVDGRSEYDHLLKQLDGKWKHDTDLDTINVAIHIITIMC